MARRNSDKRARKNKSEPKKITIIRPPRKIPVKKALRFLAVVIAILAIYMFFRNSRYFELDTIEISDGGVATGIRTKAFLELYKGRNIFEIDIRSISSRIENDHPVIRRAVVKRVFPNALAIDIVSRVPVCKVRSHKDFPVDRAGVVLEPGREAGDVPVITGLSMWLKPRVGEKIKNRKLENAFLLLDALSENPVPRGYRVTAIDVANHKNLYFYLENGIGVKIGGEKFAERLKMLKTILAKPDLNSDDIKYIDLRFKGVVIGPK